MVRSIYLVVSVWLALIASVATPIHVAAQSEQLLAQAQKEFSDGLAFAEAGRWGEALSAFRRSRALVPRASTSYNIANALYRLDRPVEALAELDAYDRMPGVWNDPTARERGDKLRGLLDDIVAEVRLTVIPSTAAVFIDGRPSSPQGRERVLLLDPGTHSLRVTQQGYETHRQEIDMERGGQATLRVELEERVPGTATRSPVSLGPSTIALSSGGSDTPAPKPADDDRDRFVKSPGFWAMIGAIAAVGIGVGVGVAVSRKDDSPSCGTTGDCATTQGLTLSSF
jgi:hypothetical protein